MLYQVRFMNRIVIIIVTVFMVSCVLHNKNINTSPQKRLVVPPDLIHSTTDSINAQTKPTSAQTIPTVTDNTSVVLPKIDHILIKKNGSQHWLLVAASPQKIWPLIRDFWISNGFTIKREEPSIGIIETAWLARHVEVPQIGLRAILSKYLSTAGFSVPIFDCFRTRLEQAEDNNSTEIYIAHTALEEILQPSSDYEFMWQLRPPEPELEADMLNRLALHLSPIQDTQNIIPKQLSRLIMRDSNNHEENKLIINADYANAWRLVGLALDRNNYNIEQHDRVNGLYKVTCKYPLELPKEINSKWNNSSLLLRIKNIFLGKKEEVQPYYWLRLSVNNGITVVTIHNSEDKPDYSDGAAQLLTILHRTI